MSGHAGHGHDDHRMDNGSKPRPNRLPVIVLTGYLGAGKTTLLNYLLREQSDKKLAVIENEVGEVSIDDALVEQNPENMPEELVVLDNGCICCTIRQDLVTTLKNLAAKNRSGQHLDGIIIEMTGCADPAPVVQTFFVDEEMRASFKIDNVVALVDAKHAIAKLDESRGDPEGKGTACAQIAFASTVLLNKVDLADDDELSKIECRLKQLNSTVEIIRCQNAVVDPARLLNVGAFDLPKVLEEQYMDEEEFATFYEPKMDRSVSNVGVRCPGDINMFAFQNFLDKYLAEEETAKDFLRVKAVLSIAGGENKFVVQCVHMLRNQAFTIPWKKGEERENRIIFIGRGMELRRQELTKGFQGCLTKPLRFPVGTKVQARRGENKWEHGKVLKQWDEFNAYRIKLREGSEVHAPVDDDHFVREPKKK